MCSNRTEWLHQTKGTMHTSMRDGSIWLPPHNVKYRSQKEIRFPLLNSLRNTQSEQQTLGPISLCGKLLRHASGISLTYSRSHLTPCVFVEEGHSVMGDSQLSYTSTNVLEIPDYKELTVCMLNVSYIETCTKLVKLILVAMVYWVHVDYKVRDAYCTINHLQFFLEIVTPGSSEVSQCFFFFPFFLGGGINQFPIWHFFELELDSLSWNLSLNIKKKKKNSFTSMLTTFGLENCVRNDPVHA